MKTKLFYLVAIFTIAMVSFSSCGGDKDEVVTPDEPTVKPIISQTDLEGTWNFQNVAVNGTTYITCGELSNDGLDNSLNMSFVFDFKVENSNYNNCHWTYGCSGNFGQCDFTYNTAKNLIEFVNSLKFQIQSYNSTTKILVFKVTATSGEGGWEIMQDVIYTLKKA